MNALLRHCDSTEKYKPVQVDPTGFDTTSLISLTWSKTHLFNPALTMSPRLVMKRLQSNCQARRTDQQSVKLRLLENSKPTKHMVNSAVYVWKSAFEEDRDGNDDEHGICPLWNGNHCPGSTAQSDMNTSMMESERSRVRYSLVGPSFSKLPEVIPNAVDYGNVPMSENQRRSTAELFKYCGYCHKIDQNTGPECKQHKAKQSTINMTSDNPDSHMMLVVVNSYGIYYCEHCMLAVLILPNYKRMGDTKSRSQGMALFQPSKCIAIHAGVWILQERWTLAGLKVTDVKTSYPGCSISNERLKLTPPERNFVRPTGNQTRTSRKQQDGFIFHGSVWIVMYSTFTQVVHASKILCILKNNIHRTSKVNKQIGAFKNSY
ncbi:hypothetical protein CLF_110385 [Clonorchis sinensis]|uniref:Uncharacterized protein n=1 Tax=Clonorchis sinensis TaxID=79923 RepID=G7YKM1_CLOSI|nr:hypothetical protein CLF_110385 [Clonorchis sinensis]